MTKIPTPWYRTLFQNRDVQDSNLLPGPHFPIFSSAVSLSCCSSMTYSLATSAVNKEFSYALDLSILYFV